jgi:hypothetical protein
MDFSVSMDGFGTLKETLEYDGFGTASYRVEAGAPYSVYVEFGTSKMQAQPFLRPAVEDVIANIDHYIDDVDSPEELVEELAKAIAKRARDRAPVDTGRLRDSITVERA